jgi:hypothetical protein
MGTQTMLDRDTLQRRLLLCLLAGPNTGLKRVCTTMTGDQFHELLYVRRRIHPDALATPWPAGNAIFRIRAPISGVKARPRASDSKRLAPGTDLLTEWHVRYGRPGIGVLACRSAQSVYSQLKTVSSSEVAAMLGDFYAMGRR